MIDMRLAIAGVAAVLAACPLALADAGAPVRHAIPTKISGPMLSFPSSARKQGIEGRLLVEVHMKADGRVREVTIVSAEPEGEFEKTVLKALRKWRFSLPEEWREGDAPKTFRIGIVFDLDPCGKPEPFPGADSLFSVCQSPLSRR